MKTLYEVLVKQNLKSENKKNQKIFKEIPDFKIIEGAINHRDVTDKYLKNATFIVYNRETCQDFLDKYINNMPSNKRYELLYSAEIPDEPGAYEPYDKKFERIKQDGSDDIQIIFEEDYYIFLLDLYEDYKNNYNDTIIFEFDK